MAIINTPLDGSDEETSSKIGPTGGTGGNTTAGSNFAKRNALLAAGYTFKEVNDFLKLQ